MVLPCFTNHSAQIFISDPVIKLKSIHFFVLFKSEGKIYKKLEMLIRRKFVSEEKKCLIFFITFRH